MNKYLLLRKIKKVNDRLSKYEHDGPGFGERPGLRDAMRSNYHLHDVNLIKKINNFAKRLNLAMDFGEKEIGSSIVEWRQLTEILTERLK